MRPLPYLQAAALAASFAAPLLAAAPSGSASAEPAATAAPAALRAFDGLGPFARFVGPEYLSALAGKPVAVFDKDSVGAERYARIVALKFLDRTPEERAETRRLLDEAGDAIEAHFEKAFPAVAAIYAEGVEAKRVNPGALHFLVDAASVNKGGRAFCLREFCIAFFNDFDGDARGWDKDRRMGGTKTMSTPALWYVLDAWRQLLPERHERFDLTEEMAVLLDPDAPLELARRARADAGASDAELDSYFIALALRDILGSAEANGNVGVGLASYYYELAGRGGEARAAVVAQYRRVLEFCKEVDRKSAAMRDPAVDLAARARAGLEFKEWLLVSARDASAAPLLRFYAGSILKVLDEIGSPRPEGTQDFPFYGRTLREAVRSLELAKP
ncbi:MAG: hypothetical protein HY059_09155 [Proteobacteria bacterium]|nr:hypothetical protein [Pseudomonadota bacterium]